MAYQVRVRKDVLKGVERLPMPVQRRLDRLLLDLIQKGPYRFDWPNYSRLSDGRYHCHLNPAYVACWKYEKGTIEIEVYYAGSRQSAPY